MSFAQNIQYLMKEHGYKSNYQLAQVAKVSQTTIGNWVKGKTKPYPKELENLGIIFNVSSEELLANELPPIRTKTGKTHSHSSAATNDTVTFPVIGNAAAGYDHYVDYVDYEDYTGDTIDVARTVLKGHSEEDFFALRIVGQSMYPRYHDGDLILVLRQKTIDYFGQVCVVLYDDDKVTLKRVEYSNGKNQMKLVPSNPHFDTMIIRGEALNHCRILGIPQLLICEIAN